MKCVVTSNILNLFHFRSQISKRISQNDSVVSRHIHFEHILKLQLIFTPEHDVGIQNAPAKLNYMNNTRKVVLAGAVFPGSGTTETTKEYKLKSEAQTT